MIWIEYIVFFVSTFCISWILSRRLPALSERFGVFDQKSFPQKVPTAGGMAIAVSFFLVVGVTAMFNPAALNASPRILLGLCVASAIVALMGFFDDFKGVSVGFKFAVQTLAALILIGTGLQMGSITNPFSWPLSTPFDPGIWGNLVLIVWILVITNAVNLIDGIDGLAAGICLISAVVLFTISHMFGEYSLSLLSVVLVGALFGFIRWNLPPAKIYLGDTGSLFLGFILAAIALTERRKGSVTVTLLVPLIILAVPLIDTGLAFFRRLLSGQSPFKGDRLHIHHRLLKLGLSPVQVNLMLYLFSIYLGLVAGAMAFFPKETAMVVLILLAIGILMGFEFLGSLERERRGGGE